MGRRPCPRPFCPGVRSGRMIFVSAQSPVDAAGGVLHPGDIVAQTRQVMRQVERVLAGFGAGLRRRGEAQSMVRRRCRDCGLRARRARLRRALPGTGSPPATGHPGAAARARRCQDQDCGGGDAGRGRPAPSPPACVARLAVGLGTCICPYKHGLQCEEMIFTGGQVSLDKRGAGGASRRSLRADPPGDGPHRHHPRGARGGLRGRVQGHRDLRGRLRGRTPCTPIFRFAPRTSATPGPATTGIPVPVLAYDAMMVEIDAFAMKRGSTP